MVGGFFKLLNTNMGGMRLDDTHSRNINELLNRLPMHRLSIQLDESN